MHVAGIMGMRPDHAATVHVQFCTVLEGVFDGIGIEVLIDPRLAIGAVAIMPSAKGLRADRPAIFHPAKMIDMMDVEVAVAAAAGPDKTVEPRVLPEQFTWLARPAL